MSNFEDVKTFMETFGQIVRYQATISGRQNHAASI